MQITVDIKGYEEVQDLLDAYPERANKAARRSINKTANGLASDSCKTIVKEYTIRRKDLNPAVKKRLAKGQYLFAQLDFSNKELPLDNFKHSPAAVTKKRPVGGVKVWVKKGSSIIRKGSFIALLTKEKDGKNEKPRIYERKGKERWPIIRLKGPAVSEMLDEKDIKDLQGSAKDRFFKAFEHEMTKGFKHGGKR